MIGSTKSSYSYHFSFAASLRQGGRVFILMTEVYLGEGGRSGKGDVKCMSRKLAILTSSQLKAKRHQEEAWSTRKPCKLTAGTWSLRSTLYRISKLIRSITAWELFHLFQWIRLSLCYKEQLFTSVSSTAWHTLAILSGVFVGFKPLFLRICAMSIYSNAVRSDCHWQFCISKKSGRLDHSGKRRTTEVPLQTPETPTKTQTLEL